MIDAGVDTVGVSGANGGPEPYGLEPKSTVLAHDDVILGKLQLKGGGQVLGNFSGEIECDGDLMIGPEAHVEADIRSTRVTIAGFVRGQVVAVSTYKVSGNHRVLYGAALGPQARALYERAVS